MSIQLFDKIRAFFRNINVYTHENLLQNQSELNRAIQQNEFINYSSANLLEQTNLQINRLERYKDFDQMDEMGEISLALDLYADEATQIDPEKKHSLSIRAKNNDVKKELEELFYNTINIDNKLRAIARYLCKYGDFAAEIITDVNRTGVVSFRPFNIYSFLRVETKYGDLVGFFFTDETMSEPIFLHPWQIMHLRLTSYENIYAPYGRCQDINSRILTPSGYVPLKDIKVGDYVYVFNNDKLTPAKVLAQCLSGKKESLKIKTLHFENICSFEHPIMVRQDDGQFIYKKANEIKIGDKLVIPRPQLEVKEHKLPPNSFNLSHIDEQLAKLFGFMFNNTIVRDKTAECSIIDDITNEKYEPIIQSYGINYTYKDNKFYIHSNDFINILENCDILKTKLPNWLYTSPRNIQMAFLEGLSNNSGMIGINVATIYYYIKADTDIIHDLLMLANLINCTCTKTADGIYIYDRPLFNNDNILFGTVTAIENVGFVETGDIQVDHPMSNFVSNGIVVHNSILDGARRDFRRLRLMEDAALIYRVCLTGNTKIWTPNGYLCIKDIKVGDRVFTMNKDETLSQTTVTNQVCNGIRPTFKVLTESREIIATSTHPFLVKDQNDDCLKYVDLKDLNPHIHLLVTPKTSNDNDNVKEINTWYGDKYGKLNTKSLSQLNNLKHEQITNAIQSIDYPTYLTKQSIYLNKEMPYHKLINLCNELKLDTSNIVEYMPYDNKCKLPNTITKDLAKFIGYYCINGYSFEDKWQIGITLTSNLEMNSKYISLFKTYYDVVLIMNNNEFRTATACDKQFYNTFKLLGLHKKCIPNWVFSLPNQFKMKFIEGITDASITTEQKENIKYYVIKSKHIELINDIKILCDQTGLITTNIDKEIDKGEVVYYLRISFEHKLSYEKIIDITYAGDQYVYDISVESSNHNFIAEGAVVHNTRAPEKRIFSIPVGNIPSNQVPSYLKMIADQFKKQRFYDPATGNVNWRYAPLIQEDDFWMPIRPDGTGPKVDTLKGAENLDQIKDIEYFKKKMIAPLKIPFSRVGIGDDTNANADKSLASVHSDFAKAVQFVQHEICIGLKKIALVHLALREFSADDMSSFNITMTASSAIDELYRMETWSSRANVIGTLMETRLFPEDWILSRFTDMTEEEIQQLKEIRAKSAQPNEPAEGIKLPGLEDIDKTSQRVISEYNNLMSSRRQKEECYDNFLKYMLNLNELDGLPKPKSLTISENKNNNDLSALFESVDKQETDEYMVSPLDNDEAKEAIKESRQIIDETHIINKSSKMTYPMIKMINELDKI